jgi:hypothetical protein
MTNQSNDRKESNWDFVNERESARIAPQSVSLARTDEAAPISAVPSNLNVQLPDTDKSRGFLMEWRKNNLDRKTAIQAITAQYNSQLDILKYQLQKAVTVSNARADRIAEEFLQKLDSEHIQILKDLGLRNAETRASGLIEVRDMIASKLREVQGKDWPKPLLDRTIDDLLALESRVAGEMLRELGE